ncbi:HMG box domain-containing protein [Mycena chlorophos]|uniref:HMG box domain-containing protein n=1 Tax=Mycena chlorophos TaxID=658473 RepID=A0A8H6SC54_MYCCL|nr:HMG box domain-containing protein [Mycena chlorophos]
MGSSLASSTSRVMGGRRDLTGMQAGMSSVGGGFWWWKWGRLKSATLSSSHMTRLAIIKASRPETIMLRAHFELPPLNLRLTSLVGGFSRSHSTPLDRPSCCRARPMTPATTQYVALTVVYAMIVSLSTRLSDKTKELRRGAKAQLAADESRVISALWRNERPEVKAAYERRAAMAACEHREKYPEYRYQPKSREQKLVEREVAKEVKRREKDAARMVSRRTRSAREEPRLLVGGGFHGQGTLDSFYATHTRKPLTRPDHHGHFASSPSSSSNSSPDWSSTASSDFDPYDGWLSNTGTDNTPFELSGYPESVYSQDLFGYPTGEIDWSQTDGLLDQQIPGVDAETCRSSFPTSMHGDETPPSTMGPGQVQTVTVPSRGEERGLDATWRPPAEPIRASFVSVQATASDRREEILIPVVLRHYLQRFRVPCLLLV